MELMDRKEQVLDVKLTKYGEYLLSVGQFEPVYYAFFDDDVMYDGQYGNLISESQNQIHDRIKDVPQMSALYSFHGLETEVTALNKFIRGQENSEYSLFSRFLSKKVQPTPERHYALSAPIGTITLDSTAVPAWNVNILNGQITGAVFVQTGSMPTLKIPLLTMTPITYRTLAVEDQPLVQIGSGVQANSSSSVGSVSDISLLTNKFDDGSFINIYEDSLVMEVEELNSIFDNANFNIEVFKVDYVTQSSGQIIRESLTPLYFSRVKKPIVRHNILLDETEIQKQESEQANIDTTSVEYFFDILIDEEIDEQLLYAYASNKASSILTGRIIKNNPVAISPNKQLYTSNVTEDDLKTFVKDCK